MRFSLRPSCRWFVVLLCSAAVAAQSSAQYGDAYHAPDYYRLAREADARATRAMNDHYARVAPSGGSGSSASRAVTPSSSGPSSWALTGQINAQRRDGARIDARAAAFEAKNVRLRALVAERQIRIVPEEYERLQQAAVDAGFDAYYASRRFGETRADFTRNLATIAADLTPGSTRSGVGQTDCAGACSMTVTGSDGSVYTGNTRAGVANGQGRNRSAAGDVYIGTFANGQMNGPMRIEYADGGVYEGATANNQIEGQGTMTFRDGSTAVG